MFQLCLLIRFSARATSASATSTAQTSCNDSGSPGADGRAGASAETIYRRPRPREQTTISTMNVLNKFLSASVRRCFRKFLKNTGRFQPCPLDVLKSFLKTQGGFRAARWMLFVDGRFRLSADPRIQFRLFASTTLNHKTVSPTGATKPFLRYDKNGCFVVRNFSGLRTKNGFFLSLRCLGIFWVVTFQSKTGRFVARNFYASS